MTARLLALLPRGGGRLLLVTEGPGSLTAALEAAGWTVSVLDPAAEARSGWGRFAAAILLEAEPPPRGQLEAVRRHLADRGRVIVGLRKDGGASRELILALSEAGFVVIEEAEAPGLPGLVAARREAFHVRPYREGDEARILPLFRRCFHVERSLARWRWAFRESPYGPGRISEAFTEDGDRLVAHYAGYPVRVHREVGGQVRVLTALQIGDTMTEPSVRHVGRGPTSLLGRTVRHYYARFCEGQVDFNYGVNTGNIQRFSMSFVGARLLEPVPYHTRETAPTLPRLHRVGRWLAGWRVERLTRFDERFDELFRRAAGAYGLLIERDARYLDWRYARCPDTEYFVYAVARRGDRGRRLAGWSVFRYRKSQREILSWGDALFDPDRPEAVRILLDNVLAAPEHQTARTVDLWLTARPDWWHRRVRDLGFQSRPEPDDLGFVFVPFGFAPEEELRARLYYMMGDTDLF